MGRQRFGSTAAEGWTGDASGADPRPDGRKKAYVRLTADFDALEVANKVCLRGIATRKRKLTADRLHLKYSHDRVALFRP